MSYKERGDGLSVSPLSLLPPLLAGWWLFLFAGVSLVEQLCDFGCDVVGRFYVEYAAVVEYGLVAAVLVVLLDEVGNRVGYLYEHFLLFLQQFVFELLGVSLQFLLFFEQALLFLLEAFLREECIVFYFPFKLGNLFFQLAAFLVDGGAGIFLPGKHLFVEVFGQVVVAQQGVNLDIGDG